MTENVDIVEAHEPVIGPAGYDQRCPACGECEVCLSFVGGVVCMACGWASKVVSEDNSAQFEAWER